MVLGAIVALIGWSAGVRHGRSATTMSTYTTVPGQRANITLPDGSSVALGVASRLDVPADYGAGNRTIRLKGEALFTVRHSAGASFTVLTGEAAVRVLGTSFLVRRYATDSTTRVAVRDGKVAVRSVVLTAHQQVDVSRDRVGAVRVANPGQFSFATGLLTLEYVPLADAVDDLNRWYDADIRINDPVLRSQPITAQLRPGSLADLTRLLELTFDVRVVRTGRVVTLFRR
jgi:ferric-dicitrate binding protein FerR (iron transport regulator)